MGAATSPHKVGVVLKLGQTTELLKWQAAHGFSGVSETTMSKVYRELDMDVPEASEGDSDTAVSLALGLMRAIAPQMTEVEVNEALRKRAPRACRELDDDFVESVDLDWVEDVATRSDKKLIQDFRKDLGEERQKRHKGAANLSERVKKAFSKGANCKSKGHQALAKAKLGSKKGGDRWWNHIPGDEEFVRARAPPGSKIVTDNINGRFLVSLGDRDRKSFSWHKRGMEDAAEMTLRCLWGWYAADTGAPDPFADET